MPVNVEDFIKMLPAVEQKAIKERAAELMAEEMTLRELRKAMQLTQVEVAAKLKMAQEGISRLEKRSDLLVSTLQKSVAALGGKLSLIVEFPNRQPVMLSGLGLENPPLRKPTKSTGRPAARKPVRRPSPQKAMAAGRSGDLR